MRTLLTLALLFSAPVILPNDTMAAVAAQDPGRVVGLVVDSSGNAVADARVQIEMTTRSGRTFKVATRTDRRGRFLFDRIPESRGVIRAGKRGVGGDRERLLVRSGETTRVGLEF